MPKQSNRSASTDATQLQRSDDAAACDLLTHAIEGSAGNGLAEAEVALECMSALVGEARGILADRDRLAAEVERLTTANERMSSVLSLIDRATIRRAKRGAADS